MKTPHDLDVVPGNCAGERLVDTRLHARALDAVDAGSITRRPRHRHPEHGQDVTARQVPIYGHIGQPTT
jgi:hypothetical protein